MSEIEEGQFIRFENLIFPLYENMLYGNTTALPVVSVIQEEESTSEECVN